MSEEGARASSDGDVGRAGWDWETKAVMDAIRAPGSIGTKNRDEATAVVKNDNKGSVARGSWLQVGDVENELSTLVDQKMAGEIGEADFRASLFRLLDIKHARSVAHMQEETLKRRSAFRRHSTWAAGTTDVAKASRRARARAARGSTRTALEETRRSNGKCLDESGKNNKSDPGTRRSRSSSRRERRGRSCSIGGVSGAGDGTVGGVGGRVAVPRATNSIRRGHRSGLPSGREGLPPPGRQISPGRRRTISIGIVAGAMTGEGIKREGFPEILRTPERFPPGNGNSNSSSNSSISISSGDDITVDVMRPSYVMMGPSFLQNTGIGSNYIRNFTSTSSSSIKIDAIATQHGKERDINRGVPGGVPRGGRFPRPAALDSPRDAQSVSPVASNSSSSSYSSCSSTGIVGAKQRRKRQQQLQQQKKQDTTAATAAAAVTGVDVSGTKKEKQGPRGRNSGNNGGDSSGGVGDGLSTREETNPNLSSPSIDSNAGLLGKPGGMANNNQNQDDDSKYDVSRSHSHSDLSVNSDVTHCNEDAKHCIDDVIQGNDDVSRSKNEVSHSKDDVNHGIDDVSHSNDGVSHSNDDVSHGHDDVSHSHDEVRRSKDAVSRSRDDISHGIDDVNHSNDDVSPINDGISRNHDEVSRSYGDVNHSNDDVRHSRDDINHGIDDVSQSHDEVRRSKNAVSCSRDDSHGIDNVSHSNDNVIHDNDDGAHFNKQEKVCATSDDVRGRGPLRKALEGASREEMASERSTWEADPLPKTGDVHCICTIS